LRRIHDSSPAPVRDRSASDPTENGARHHVPLRTRSDRRQAKIKGSYENMRPLSVIIEEWPHGISSFELKSLGDRFRRDSTISDGARPGRPTSRR
jgi:hypothetical protein